MGHHAGRRPRIRAPRLVGRDLPRSRHPHHRACLQSSGRRTSRRLRSKTEALIMALVEIENLSVEFPTQGGVMRAVDGVSLTLNEGEVLGVVGESGSGKSVTMLALMGLIPFPGRVKADKLSFNGRDLLTISDKERRQITGKDVAMIFQEPTTSLNPSFTVGFQLTETLRLHEGMDRKAAERRAVELLGQVGIPSPESRLSAYPHQMSGGMNQRVMVMYAGQIMEERSATDLFASPQHPYTAALLAALPERSEGGRLATIPGVVPGLYDRPKGCLFSPRCAYATEHSRSVRPDLRAWAGGHIRCHYPLGDPNRTAEIRHDRPVGAEAAP